MARIMVVLTGEEDEFDAFDTVVLVPSLAVRFPIFTFGMPAAEVTLP
jgi:hypothetical protein